MNNRIKEITKQVHEKVSQSHSTQKPAEWLDAFILELSRTIIFECSDVVRNDAKNYSQETQIILKSTAVDILDHFGL